MLVLLPLLFVRRKPKTSTSSTAAIAAAIAVESPSQSLIITVGLSLRHNTVLVDDAPPIRAHPPVVPQHSTIDLNLFFKSTPSLCARNSLAGNLTVAEDVTVIKGVLEGHGEVNYSDTCKRHIDTFNLPYNFWSVKMASFSRSKGHLL